MLPAATPAYLLSLALLPGAPVEDVPAAGGCEDVRRIELSRGLPGTAREICVSPGLLTGFLFDRPVNLELQDEVRFVEVTRSRSGMAFVPPRDMVHGERLRLTARYADEAAQQGVTFTLVEHTGRATHQVEVYRDQRTRESFEQEVLQERAKNQQLLEENQQLRAQLERPASLLALLASGALQHGVQVEQLILEQGKCQGCVLTIGNGFSYSSDHWVALELWVRNASAEPWTVEGASLTSAQGTPLREVAWKAETIPPHQEGRVMVEATASQGERQGGVTLRLWGTGPNTITLPQVTFP